jgi:hypothetical protein
MIFDDFDAGVLPDFGLEVWMGAARAGKAFVSTRHF